jgi:hypothetical protein
VHYFFKTSKSRLAYEKALLNHQIISSLECYKELVEVLSRPKFSKYFSEIDKSIFLINYFHSTQFVKVNIVVEVCRDPKDNKFLALAFEHSSDFIVSADNDLPILNPYKNIPILTANGFLE